MNYDLLFAVVFYLVLYSLFVIYRKRFEVQGKFFILYKTRLGLRLMDRLSVHKRLLGFLGLFSVLIGFLGMGLIFYILIKGTYSMLFVPSTAPVLSPVLPGISVAGLPMLSFWHWIIAILLIATIHEFSHGIYARKIGVKIKSSGFAFLGPLLAAFVEPDEKQLAKKKHYQQLEVLSAGPFSNILFAGIILLIMVFAINPASNFLIEEKGLIIVGINSDMPINSSGLKKGMSIEKIGDYDVTDRVNFVSAIDNYNPGDKVFVKSNLSFYEVEMGKNPKTGKTMIGLFVSPASVGLREDIKANSFDFYPAYAWIVELMFWLFTISLGIGLFNLLPLGPVDGGRMFYIGMLAIFKNEKAAKKLYLIATVLCLLLIVVNLLPYIIQFIEWIVSLII